MAHQLPDGDIVDPVLGRVGGYGESMLGQAMAESGVATNNQALISSGLAAELNELTTPNGGGFEELNLAGAYIWNQKNLANSPSWQAARPTIAKYLADHPKTRTSDGAAACYANIHCWTNLKLVEAYANIELLDTGLHGGSSTASLNHRPALSQNAKQLIEQAAQNTSHNAKHLGSEHFNNAGILSDPTRNPLAYQELSTMMLGRVMDALGNKTPRVVQQAFERNARALVGYMAPDGDGAYIGRGQGQVWNVAAAFDGLAIAARHSNNPVWRGRFLAGAARALQRLETTYKPGLWGMPLTPRLLDNPQPNYAGIDRYATTVGYNGLALWALQDAIQQLRSTKPAPIELLPADANGTFIDPSHTEFAAVRRGDLWWAIHAADTHTDARYDFGLIAAEQKTPGGLWLPAMPYRPITGKKTSGGPVLIKGKEHLVPEGEHISATAGGKVVVEGGWSTEPNEKPTAQANTKWVFRPIGKDAVGLSFESERNKTYQFRVWYEAGSKVVQMAKGMKIYEPDGRRESYTLNLPTKISAGGLYHSAYDETLDSSTLTVHTGKKETINYVTTF